MFKPILEREYKVKTTVTYEAPHHIFHDSKTTYALLDGPEKEFKSCTIRVTHTDPEAVVEAFYQYLLQEHTINPEGGVDDTAEFSNFWGRR